MRPLSRRGVSALRKAASARNRQTRGGTAIVRPLLARAEGVFDGKERFMRQKTCPYCGDLHDMDDAICPHCGRRLMEL